MMKTNEDLPPRADPARLLELIDGYQTTCAIVAAVQLGIFDNLRAAEPEAKGVRALAAELGANGPALERLLRVLEALDLVRFLDLDRVASTPTGRLLSERGLGVRERVQLVGGQYLAAWAELRHSIVTAEPAFEHVFKTDVWNHRAENPELDEAFNGFTSSVQARVIGSVLRAYDFSGHKSIVDVGGGHGELLAGILRRAPEARGVLFDQPHVVEGARRTFEQAGVAARTDLRAGSFFEGVPEGGQVYVLKHILHDWSDEECVTILKNCRAVMSDGARLLILENLLPEPSGPRRNAPETTRLLMLDLHMMAVLGGRERTRAEYASLTDAAGLRIERVLGTREGAPDILEARLRA